MNQCALTNPGSLPTFHQVKGSVHVKLKTVVSKVITFAKLIFEKIKQLFLFPTRYFGAKTWSIPGLVIRFPIAIFKRALGKGPNISLKKELFGSGYHYKMEKELTKEELEPYLIYARANASVHLSNPWFVESLDWQEMEGERFFDPETGLKIAVFQKEAEIIVSFGALRSNESELTDNVSQNLKIKRRGIGNSIRNLFGASPIIYSQANDWLIDFIDNPKFKDKKITLSGQCYGGSFASYLALKNSLPAVCINTLPMGAGLQQDLENKILEDAEKYVTHISVKNDYISDIPGTEFVDRIISSLGLRTPGNFGHRYTIPTAYSTPKKTHCLALGSIESHLGIKKK